MDLLYVHLLLNHAPVIGLAGCILLLAGALMARSRDVAIAALVGLVLVALLSLPVYFTGDPAAEGVEHIEGVNQDAIEEHEDAAVWAIYAVEIAGALALVLLIVSRRRGGVVPRGALIATLVVTLLAAAAIARTANLGGKIRHTEIGNGQAGDHEGEGEGGGRGRGRGRGGD